MTSKRYGLILPGSAKKETPTFQASRNVFGCDSDSDDDGSKKKPVLLLPNQNIKRQAKIEQEKAMKEDPTVYQYDEIYDTMASQKEEKISKKKEDKKPRYIEKLLKTASKRKIENERRVERQIQKEREKEGEEFADKEVFVTSAYKKKLEEMRLEEEKEKREEYLENIGDVTKQRDLGGFYRHLYEQRLGSDKKPVENEETKGSETPEVASGNKTPEPPVQVQEMSKDKEKHAKKRNYRKRKSSGDLPAHLSEGEIVESDDEINRMNLSDVRNAKNSKQSEENIDADSDFSVNDPSENESEPESPAKEKEIKNKEPVPKSDIPKTDTPEVDSPKHDTEFKKPKEDKENKLKPEPKPKVDIWKKRTVGEVFDQALKRYYERKTARAC